MTSSRLFVLLGHPVAHSVSPAIHGAAYRALGLPHRYEVIDCPTVAHVRAQVERLRVGEVAGANVTVPWKRLALDLSDEHDASARETGVANVLCPGPSGVISASNTDAVALAEEIAELHPAPASAAVIGSGGAACAAVVACRMLGLSRVYVSSRSWQLEDPEVRWSHLAQFRALGAAPVPWANPAAAERGVLDMAEAVRDADVIIQATSAGMHGAGPGEAVSDWIPWRELRPNAVAIDVVYNPPRTPFLDAAAAAQVPHRGGLGMLVRQAAAAMRIWLGQEPGWAAPDLRELSAAAERALFARGHM